MGTGKRMTELIEEDLPGHPAGALSGPNLAKEVLGGLAAAVIAMLDHPVAQRLQSLVRSTLFGVYTATDVIGVEADGALKNVVAIAAGMADGLGAGDNTRVILRQVAAERQNGQAEYPAREQVDDLEQHPGKLTSTTSSLLAKAQVSHSIEYSSGTGWCPAYRQHESGPGSRMEHVKACPYTASG